MAFRISIIYLYYNKEGRESLENFKLKINGLLWKIFYVHNGDENLKLDGVDCMGITYFKEQQIYLDSDMSRDLFRKTVIHELTHAFLFSFGHHLECDEAEEAVCDFLGSHLDRIYKTTNKIMTDFTNKAVGNNG